MNLSKENMGLNIPILLANSQPLEPWNPVNQFSPPPMNDRNHQLRVSLPLPFTNPGDLSTSGTNNLTGGVTGGGGARSLFGGSSNSDFAGSPHKPMDTTDIDENNDKCRGNNGDGATTPSNLHETSITSNEGRLSAGANETPGRHSENGSSGGGVGGGGSGSGRGSGGTNGEADGGVGLAAGNGGRRSDGNSGTDAGSSPIPNTNNFEAHKQRQLIAGGAISSGSREQDDLDIKQELLENYFHAPHPPAPPDSHRSYSPSDDNRTGGGGDCSDDFAQDLRVSAAAAAAAKGIDFTRFVLPPGLRRSTTDSIDDKFTPLNMRKLNSAASNSGQTPAHMLVGSMLSNESMSEDNNSVTSGRRRSASLVGNQNGLNGVQDGGTPTASAVATAAALYAESLNRDDCDHVGSNVSHKLRTMDRTQRIIAEKLIGEVLFYGQFNELERSARIQPK